MKPLIILPVGFPSVFRAIKGCLLVQTLVNMFLYSYPMENSKEQERSI